MHDSIKYADYIMTDRVITDVSAVIIQEFNGKYPVERNRFSLSYVYTVDGVDYTGAFVNSTSVSTGTKNKSSV